MEKHRILNGRCPVTIASKFSLSYNAIIENVSESQKMHIHSINKYPNTWIFRPSSKGLTVYLNGDILHIWAKYPRSMSTAANQAILPLSYKNKYFETFQFKCYSVANCLLLDALQCCIHSSILNLVNFTNILLIYLITHIIKNMEKCKTSPWKLMRTGEGGSNVNDQQNDIFKR